MRIRQVVFSFFLSHFMRRKSNQNAFSNEKGKAKFSIEEKEKEAAVPCNASGEIEITIGDLLKENNHPISKPGRVTMRENT